MIRKLGSIVRGKATPFQLILAAVLGGILGFMPGLSQAAGLIVVVVILLLILNANLALAGLTGLLAKLIAWLALPMTFAVGRFLLDGPTRGLFAWLINAPVLALFGFEYYSVSGGLLVGLVFGLLVGLLVVKLVGGFRRKMAGMEENSERYQKWASKGWVKWCLWLLFGGGTGKLTYAQILTRRIGNPIRIWGLAVAVLILVGLVVARYAASDQLLASWLTAGLERANGATVDLEGFELNVSTGQLKTGAFAMADPNNLKTNLIQAAGMEARISGADLLRRRIAIDRLMLSDAVQGAKRSVPGKLVGPPPTPPPPQPGPGKPLDEYLKEAQVWKERLAQAREWLEKLSKPEAEKPETLKERLDRLIREDGYANVRADHLIEGAPSFLLRELVAEKVRVPGLPGGQTLDIHATNLSTQPNLLKDPPRITITSSKGTLDFAADLAAASAASGQNTIRFHYLGLPVESIAGQLSGSPVAGGTIDLRTAGSFDAGQIDWPLSITVNNSNISAGGSQARVSKLTIPVGLRGPLDAPRVIVDDKALGQALIDAGASELLKALPGDAGKVVDVLRNPPKDPTDLLGNLPGLLGPTSKPAKKK